MICKISESLELLWGKIAKTARNLTFWENHHFVKKSDIFSTFGQIPQQICIVRQPIVLFCISNHKNQLYNTYNQVIKLLLVIYDHFKLNFRPFFGQICTVIGYILAKIGFTFHAITFEPFLFRTWLTPHFKAERQGYNILKY